MITLSSFTAKKKVLQLTPLSLVPLLVEWDNIINSGNIAKDTYLIKVKEAIKDKGFTLEAFTELLNSIKSYEVAYSEKVVGGNLRSVTSLLNYAQNKLNSLTWK